MAYIHRQAEERILSMLANFSVVGVTGPRQSGKSTMLKRLLNKEYAYVSFDDYDVVESFYADPKAFMFQFSNKVIFDEVQQVPEIFSYIKIAVDNDRGQAGKFLLTGSAQFSMIKKISDTLAGRIGLLTLLPMQFLELPDYAKEQVIYRGAYPELVTKNYEHFQDWFSSYLNTYLTRDVGQLRNIGDMRDFRRLISLLAANTAQQLNMSRFASDLGVSVLTVKHWISVLEASYVVFLLPPYFYNFGKRIVKSPKIYFYDTGFVTYLTGIKTKEQYEKGPMSGAIFENYIVSEVLKSELNKADAGELFYFRSSKGEEVDLIIDKGASGKVMIEIKNSMSFKPLMLKTIDKLIDKQDQGLLLYRGEDWQPRGNIRVLNYQSYFSG